MPVACEGKNLWNGKRNPVTLVNTIEAKKRSEEHTSELQSRLHLVCRLLLEKKKVNRQLHTWFPLREDGRPSAIIADSLPPSWHRQVLDHRAPLGDAHALSVGVDRGAAALHR